MTYLPDTARLAIRTHERADIRATVALCDYRYARGQWMAWRTNTLRWEAIVARTRWTTYADLLREPLLAEERAA